MHFSYFPNEEKEIKEKSFSNISVGMKSNEKRRWLLDLNGKITDFLLFAVYMSLSKILHLY